MKTWGLFVIADGYTSPVHSRDDLVRHGYLRWVFAAAGYLAGGFVSLTWPGKIDPGNMDILKKEVYLHREISRGNG